MKMVLFGTDLGFRAQVLEHSVLEAKAHLDSSRHSMKVKLLLVPTPEPTTVLSAAPFLKVLVVQALGIKEYQFHCQGKFPEWLSSPLQNHDLLCPALD